MISASALELAEESVRQAILDAQERSESARTVFELQQAIDALRGAEALAQLVILARVHKRLGWE